MPHVPAFEYLQIEAELLSNVHIITKLIKREQLRYSVPDERGLIETVFSGILNNSPESTQTREITHEMSYRPTAAEIRQIIRNFNENEDRTLKNVGFKYSTGKQIMLSGINVQFSYELPVTRQQNQIVPATELLRSVVSSRVNLLRQLEEPNMDE